MKIGTEFSTIDSFINGFGNCDKRAIGINTKNTGNIPQFGIAEDELSFEITGKDAFKNKAKLDKREKLFNFCEANEVYMEDFFYAKKMNRNKESLSTNKQSIISLCDKRLFKRKRQQLYHFDKKA